MSGSLQSDGMGWFCHYLRLNQIEYYECPVKIKFDCQDNAKIVPWFYQSLANIGITLAALHFCLAILVDHSKTNV